MSGPGDRPDESARLAEWFEAREREAEGAERARRAAVSWWMLPARLGLVLTAEAARWWHARSRGGGRR